MKTLIVDDDFTNRLILQESLQEYGPVHIAVNGVEAVEAISLCARIVGVADVYDALVSRRVYKQAFSHEIARSLIIEGRGTQFD